MFYGILLLINRANVREELGGAGRSTGWVYVAPEPLYYIFFITHFHHITSFCF